MKSQQTSETINTCVYYQPMNSKKNAIDVNLNPEELEEQDSETIVKHHLGDITLNQMIFCLCVGGFLASFDVSIVVTIFNEIGTEFKSSNLSVWIMSSYMLSTTTLQPLYGKVSDIFGRKTVLVFVLSIFLLGSFFCGTAGTMTQMSIARVMAGVGGGGLMAIASTVIHDLIPMRDRAKYQSYVNIGQTVGNSLGAPLGGLINDTLGWRYCFYLNVPPCLFILYFYIFCLENYNLQKDLACTESLKEKLQKIDFIGVLLLLIANLSLITGTSLGGNILAWSDPWVLALLASTVFFLALFGFYEFSWARYPIASKKVLRNHNVFAVCLNSFFLCSATMAFNFLIPQFFMGVAGYNASSAGTWVLPRALMVVLGCWTAGRYLSHTGRYKYFIVSLLSIHVCATVGIGIWEGDSPLVFELLCLHLEGLCFGSVLVASMIALVSDLPQSDTSSATSIIFLCRSMGWFTGGVLTATILQANLKSKLYQDLPGPEAIEVIEFIRTSISKIRYLDADVQKIAINSLAFSIFRASLYGITCSILCFCTSLAMKNNRLGS